MDVPVACSLSAVEARTQLGEWRELIRGEVARAGRPSPTRAELLLRPDGDVGAVADLARREVACCPFFEMVIEVTADGLILVVEVPADGAGALDELLGGGRS